MDYSLLGTVILGVIIAVLISSIVFALIDTARNELLGAPTVAA